jgi:hypothetical protein
MVAALALATLPAAAQERVDERRPAAPDGTVAIETTGGSVRVEGWDRSEVAVTGSVGPGADHLSLRGDGRKIRVEVEPSLHEHVGHADLTVKVPARSQVRVESFQARVEVSDVTGGVRVETVNGGIVVSGAAGQVYV